MSSLSKLPYALVALGSFATGILINLELNLKVFAKAHTDEQVTFNGEFSTTIRGPGAYHFSSKCIRLFSKLKFQQQKLWRVGLRVCWIFVGTMTF